MKIGDDSRFRTQHLGEHKAEYTQYEQALKGVTQQPAPAQPQMQDPMQGAIDRFTQMVDTVNQFLNFTDQLLQLPQQVQQQIPQQVMQQLPQIVQQQVQQVLQQALPQVPQEIMQQIPQMVQQQLGEVMQQNPIQQLLQLPQQITQQVTGQVLDQVNGWLQQNGLPTLPDNLSQKAGEWVQQKVMDLIPQDARNILEAAQDPKAWVQNYIRDGVKDFLEPYKEGGGHTEGFKRLGQWGGMEMPDKLYQLGAARGKGKTIAEGEAHFARFGELDAAAQGAWGTAYANGHTDFLSAQGRVFGDAGMKNGALEAYIGVEGRAELIGAHYNFGYATPTVNIAGHDIGIKADVQADAFVGAQGYAEAMIRLGKDPRINVGGEAFVGASATIQGQASLGDMAEIHGSATGWAGAGIKGKLDVGFEDGKLNFDMGFGAALGLGFELDWGFSIDVGAVGDFFADVGGAVMDGLGDVGEAIGGFAEDVGDAIGDAAEAVGDAIGDAANAVGDAVSDFFSGW